ncbi:MAG TPA: glycogen debranching N-terminal domain-containing protein [Candidatus Limnocylindrales bacterium]|nr:glycogen debranching N-terminal domain-containing protein [Candidatus Limnocylindrales bacterium]
MTDAQERDTATQPLVEGGESLGPEALPAEVLSEVPAEDIGALPVVAATPAVQRATDLTGVLILKHDELFLMTDPFGDIHPDGRGLGLYQGDTRILSHYELRLNGERPVILRTGSGGSYTGTLQLTNPAYLRHPERKQDEQVVLRGRSLGIVRERLIADGFRERITVHNFTLHAERLELAIRLDADFADIFEVRGLERERRGERLPAVRGDGRIVFRYLGTDGLERRCHVALSEPARSDDEGVLHLAWTVPPGGWQRLTLSAWPETVPVASAVRGRFAEEGLLDAPVPPMGDELAAAAHRAWKAGSTSISTPDAFADRAIRRAIADLRFLVNQGPGKDERYVAAGVPWFSCLFGRDSIITALQLLSVRPQVAVDTLSLLARLQATERDDWRDAEPGKILHELRSGELAHVGEIPHTPYYGTVDATPLWLILLDETQRWTGDMELVDRLWPNAMAALRWIELEGDLDGDGFVEYQRRSRRGLLNQGWKDSADANRFRDGRLAQAPLALVEVQAYVHAARRGLARLARLRGDEAFAREQEAAAETLRQRFEEAFWMDDAGTYAMALDAEKRQVDAISSNPGHALWCGIASPERAARVATSLTGGDLWSGWGVRTLSSRMAGYNPLGYHIGSVWPHDNAICAEGLARYGHWDEASRIAGALIESTSYFRDSRLPELFCGFSRDESPYPVPYPVACSPQAWAAASIFQLIRAMLGMRADASARTLELVRPHLPDWLPQLRIQNLRVGEASVDLLASRETGMTGVDVLARTGDLSIVVRI